MTTPTNPNPSSRPPIPFERHTSFAAWNVSHPGEPHQGNALDNEFNEAQRVSNEIIARLNEIQRDDGLVRAEKVYPAIADAVTNAAVAAALETYADNLASVADKALARANLQIPEHFPQADGATLRITSSANNWPVFPAGTLQANQQATGPFPGVLSTSTNFSRQFRSAVLLGTEHDWASSNNLSVPAPPAALRVDNISMALLFGGTTGKAIDGGAGPEWPANTFQGDYLNVNFLPSIENPFATIRQIVDAVDSREAAHLSGYDHTKIPTATEKSVLAAAVAAGAGTTSFNRLATMGDISASGSLTASEVAAISDAESPSALNVVITSSALTTALSGKADAVHIHTWDDLTDSLGVPLQSIIEAKADDAATTTALAGKADAAHTHAIADVTGLQAELDGKASATDAGLAKAWVSFDGSTTPPTIKASLNVTSVTRNATGIYTINFTNALADANYCWVGSGRNNSSSQGLMVSQDSSNNTQTTTALNVTTFGDNGSAQNATWVNVVVYR